MHILIPWRKHMQSFITIGQNCKSSCTHMRYPLSIYWGWKMTKFTTKKKWKQNDLTIISKPHAHIHTMKKTCKVSKRSVQNCKRSCAHKTPRVNVDERMDGRTNRRKFARLLSCPAKADATTKDLALHMKRLLGRRITWSANSYFSEMIPKKSRNVVFCIVINS